MNQAFALPFFMVFGFVLVALKLGEYIDWPWFWVIAPFWLPFAIVSFFAIVLGVCFIVVGLAAGLRK